MIIVTAIYMVMPVGKLRWRHALVGGVMAKIGATADRIGRRRVFLIGVAGFALASAIAGIAPTFEVLVAGRGGPDGRDDAQAGDARRGDPAPAAVIPRPSRWETGPRGPVFLSRPRRWPRD